MPRKSKEKKEKKETKVQEKKEKKGVSQKVVVNVKVGETKRAKRTYTRRSKPTASTSDGARPGPTGIYSYVPAGLPPVAAYSIPQQQMPVLPDAFKAQPQPAGLSLEDVKKVGREQAIGLLKEAEPAIRMAIEDISQKRANEAVIKAQGAEQRAELEKKFVIPVSKSPITLAKEKLPSMSRMKGQPDSTPENFGVGMNEIQQELQGRLKEIKNEPDYGGTWRDVIDLTDEEITPVFKSTPVIKIEPGTEPAPDTKPEAPNKPEPPIRKPRRGRPIGSKNRPKDVILAEKEAKAQRKTKKVSLNL